MTIPFVPVTFSDEKEHRRKLAEAIRRIFEGRVEWSMPVTLTANSATTTVSHPRLRSDSHLSFMPTTSNAAGGVGGLYVSSQGDGTATLTHANNAQTDRVFNVLISS